MDLCLWIYYFFFMVDGIAWTRNYVLKPKCKQTSSDHQMFLHQSCNMSTMNYHLQCISATLLINFKTNFDCQFILIFMQKCNLGRHLLLNFFLIYGETTYSGPYDLWGLNICKFSLLILDSWNSYSCIFSLVHHLDIICLYTYGWIECVAPNHFAIS